MSSPHDATVRRRRSIPPDLPVTLRAAQGQRAVRWLFVPVAIFGLMLMLALLIDRPDGAGRRYGALAVIAATTIPPLVLLWQRRGVNFGFDADGVWLRTSIWSTEARFVPWDRIQHVILDARYDRRLYKGVAVVVRTVDGELSRPHVVPCRESGHIALVDQLRRHGRPFRDFSTPLSFVQRRDLETGLPVADHAKAGYIVVALVLMAAAAAVMNQLTGR